MRQKIYPDKHGLDTWDLTNFGQLSVHLVNSQMFHHITGIAPPASPITVEQYTKAGLPWFELYDEDKGAVAAPARLRKVKTMGEMNAIRQQNNMQRLRKITLPWSP